MQIQFTLLGRASALALGMALGAASSGAVAQAPKPATAEPAKPADPAKIVARVQGQPITEADLAVAAEDPALSIPGANEAQKRDLLISYVADLKLGAKAAEDAKLASGPEFTRRLAYLRDKLLVDEYLDAQVKKAVTPEAARKLYEETSKEMKPEEEVRARHILVESEEDAKKAAARVKGGEDFAKVAAEISTDPGSKTDGGELGFFTKDRMVAPFAEAAFKMKPNEISDPVKSQFGWHVIQVEEKRTKPVPSFDEMKEQVEQYLTRRAQQEAVLALRATGKLEKLDDKGNVIPPAEKPAAAPAPTSSDRAPSSAAPK
jgi:peptidyl-prolyl cis-trans isomerase C